MTKKNNTTYICNLCDLDLTEARVSDEEVSEEQYYRLLNRQLADATKEAADVHICTECVSTIYQREDYACWR